MTAITPTGPDRILHGSCLCGRVAFEVADRFSYAMYCHCSLCRRTTGSAFKALAGIESEALVVTRGEEATLRYGRAGWHNVNCGTCGSMLYAVVRDGALVHVSMGVLAEAPRIRPTMHIFVGSKALWFDITDGLPQHDAFPPT